MSAEEIREAAAEFCDPTGTLKGEFGLWIDRLEGKTESWEPYGMLQEAAGNAALLHYFSDVRHTRLERPIEPDGSNIQHLGLLRDTFDWYTEWMVMLHQTKFVKIEKEDKEGLLDLWVRNWGDLKSFIPEMDVSRIDDLDDLGEKLYDSPLEHLATVFQQRPELDWVREWREEILKVLIEMQNAAERFPECHPDRDAAVRRVRHIFVSIRAPADKNELGIHVTASDCLAAGSSYQCRGDIRARPRVLARGR